MSAITMQTEWTRFLSNPSRYFETIDDAGGYLKNMKNIVRVNSSSGPHNDRRANLRIRLSDGSEATVDVWGYGSEDGTGLIVTRVR